MYRKKETPAEYQARQAMLAAKKAQSHAEYQVRQAQKAERQNVNTIISEANEHKAHKNYQAALSKYAEALSIKPNHKSALLYQGQCFAGLGEYQRALQNYQAAENADDPMFKKQEELRNSIGFANAKLAEQYFNNEDYNACISFNSLALSYLQNQDQIAFCHYYMGISHQFLRQLPQAIQCLEKALHYNPDRERFLTSLSICYKKIIETSINSSDKTFYKQQHQRFLQSQKKYGLQAEWLTDDLRWLSLSGEEVESSRLAKPYFSASTSTSVSVRASTGLQGGEDAFKRIVFSWQLDDIQRGDHLTPLNVSYNDIDKYYDAMLPLVLEEAKATMRQYLENMDDPDNSFLLQVHNITLAKNINNPSSIIISRIPKKYLEQSQTDIALWLKCFNAKNHQIITCLGLASIDEQQTKLKLIANTHQLSTVTFVNAWYLGSLVTHKRMYAVCYDKPKSAIIKQISSGNLPQWNKNLCTDWLLPNNASFNSLDDSQRKAVNLFLTSPNDNIYLLQGPPGTGKTTTIVALLAECVEKKLRILVTAPSNKAVQEIAVRLFNKLPNVKMMLAGVEEKLLEELRPIFVHQWHQYFISQIEEIVTLFTSKKKMVSFLKGNLSDENFLQNYDQIVGQLMKYHANTASQFEKLRTHLQVCNSTLRKLTPNQKKQWVNYFRIKTDLPFEHENQYVSYQEHANKSQLCFQNIVALFSDTQDDELMLLDYSQVVFASLSVCGRQCLQRLQAAFDVTIIDEAGQAVSAETLLPFRFQTKKALLVGDPMQLPATTLSDQAEATHFSESTLSHLIKYGAPYHMLTYQYRMHPEIRRFPSDHFYHGCLQDGSNINNRRNPLAALDAMPFIPYGFIDITSGRELRQDTSFYNKAECDAIERLIIQMNGFVKNIQIGVIAFYRAQVEKLKQQLAIMSNVLVATVDGFQGGECDCIIISCVRANPRGNIGFAKDFRRINVAITRARYGLVIVGNKDTLQRNSNNILAEIITDADQRNKIFSESIISSPPSFAIHGSSRNPHNKYRIAPCAFFAKGNCRKGDDCTFRHDSAGNESTTQSIQYHKR